MEIEVHLPQWGMEITEATVVRWLKSVGDEVTEDEPLVEVETSKATDFVNATASGVLVKIAAEAGADVPVGDVLAVIETAG